MRKSFYNKNLSLQISDFYINLSTNYNLRQLFELDMFNLNESD